MTDSNRLAKRVAFLPAIGVIVVTVGAVLALVQRSSLNYYDEGVYYYQSVLWMEGQRPYTDFFVPQPPGILLIGAASNGAGAGLPGVRIAIWGCGLAVLWQTFWLTRWAVSRSGGDRPALTGVTAAAFVVASNRFVYVLAQGATDTPALALTLAAAQLLASGRSPLASGGVLGLATLFRLQPASLAPGFALFLIALLGWRAAVRPAFHFAIGFGLVAVAIHGGLATTLPGYWDGTFGFQLQRTRVGLGHKLRQLFVFLGEPHIGFAVMAAAGVAVGREMTGRALSWIAFFGLAVTTLAGNVLYLTYYVPILPYLAAVAAMAIDAIARATGGGGRVYAAVVVAMAAGTGLNIKAELTELRRLDQPHRRFIEAIREAQGSIVFTDDGRLALLAGKRLVPDHYVTDPNALFELQPDRFRAWIREVIPRADVIAVTPNLLRWLTQADAKFLLDAGKAFVFESKDTERIFQERVREMPQSQ